MNTCQQTFNWHILLHYCMGHRLEWTQWNHFLIALCTLFNVHKAGYCLINLRKVRTENWKGQWQIFRIELLMVGQYHCKISVDDYFPWQIASKFDKNWNLWIESQSSPCQFRWVRFLHCIQILIFACNCLDANLMQTLVALKWQSGSCKR